MEERIKQINKEIVDIQREFIEKLKELYVICEEQNRFVFGWEGGEITDDNEDEFNEFIDSYNLDFSTVTQHENIFGQIINFAVRKVDEAVYIEIIKSKRMDGWDDCDISDASYTFPIYFSTNLDTLPTIINFIKKGLNIE